MRTTHGRSSLIWLPVLGLAAFGFSNQGVANAQNTPAPTPAPAAAPAPAPMPAPVTVNLAAKNGSGITGTVSLTSRGDSTDVAVRVNGGRPGTGYPSHVHAGTCAKPGEVVAPLGTVNVGQDRSGTSTTAIATSVLDAARAKNGSLVVQAHSANLRPAACADLPAR